MAESNNNLDDLILTEPENEGSKKKGLLVLIGLVVLLAIIGVVLTNIIMSSGDEENKTTQVKDALASNIKMEQATVQIKAPKVNEPAPIDDDLAPLDEQDAIAREGVEKKDDSLQDKIITGASVVTAGTATALMQRKTQAKEEPVMRDEILEETPKRAEPRKVVKKAPPKRVIKKEPRRARVHKKVVYGGNVYIQVGSFSKGPNSNFINKIRRMGLRYRIKEVNGFRRVLVGPFRSVQDAQRVLPKVKAYISRSAFIKKR